MYLPAAGLAAETVPVAPDACGRLWPPKALFSWALKEAMWRYHLWTCGPAPAAGALPKVSNTDKSAFDGVNLY